MPAFIDLSEQRFGRVVVLPEHEKRTSNGRERTYWKCLCDCGNTTWAQVNMLRNGHKRSCGCLWDSTLPRGLADFRAKYRSYKSRAKQKNLAFVLSESEFRSIAGSNCHYCNQPPPNTKIRDCFNGSSLTNGIDRKDNTKGYINSNCLPCCSQCNRAKGEMSYEVFLELCRKVTNNADTRQNR